MKNRLIILLILFVSFQAFSQFSLRNEGISIPQEKIYVHHNTTFLLTGEYFYYKVYCLNDKTKKLTDFSKIAYVELVGSDKQSVFKHKIKLVNGIGQGDFFIPTTVPSGKYKVIAYTQWMRNSEIANFYQNDISIINPFQSDQKAILESNVNSQDIDQAIYSTNNDTDINSSIELKVNSQNFATRQKVTLNINKLSNDLYGNYSVSVRKIEKLQIPKRTSAKNFVLLNNQNEGSVFTINRTNIFIPELRGELISGKVIDPISKAPVNNVKVALSIPGENYIFKISNSNELGVFYFNIENEYNSENAIIQILGDEKEKYNFSLNEHSSIDYSQLVFTDFIITPEIKDLILTHSINNQIENAYANVKTDNVKNIKDFPPFFSKASHEYLLDDYTRFQTIKETLLEVVEQASVRQRKSGDSFHVRVYDEDVESGLESLLLIDGFFIQNHNDIVDSKANKIKKISVVNEQYIYGSQIFEGIIFMETFEGDYKNTLTGNYGKNIKLFKPLAQKEYFKQVYDDRDKLNRIPDYRSQLLWEPNLMLTKKETKYTFYTSDLTGEFEINLEGFNNNGIPVSIRKTITVN